MVRPPVRNARYPSGDGTKGAARVDHLEAVVKITMLGRRAISGAAALSMLLGGVAMAATGSGPAETPPGPPTTLPAAATTHANEHAHLPATVPRSAPGEQTATTTSPSTQDGVGSGAGENHGACVSAVARLAPAQAGGGGAKPADPSAHGRAVSAAAHSCPKPSGADQGPEDQGAAPTPESDHPSDSSAAVRPHGGGHAGNRPKGK